MQFECRYKSAQRRYEIRHLLKYALVLRLTQPWVLVTARAIQIQLLGHCILVKPKRVVGYEAVETNTVLLGATSVYTIALYANTLATPMLNILPSFLSC